MDSERGDRGEEEVELQETAIDMVDRDTAGESEHFVNSPAADQNVCLVPEGTEKKYRKIVAILKKQTLSEAVKEEWDSIKKKMTGFCRPQETDEVDACLPITGEISVETMKFAIKCLHKTQNPVHSFMNTLQVKAGNKEKLLEELDSIPKVKRPVGPYFEEFITKEAFCRYTAERKRDKTNLEWWYCCDGDPEAQSPKGTLIDYFYGIAGAQKVTANPISILFPIFGIALILIHLKTSENFKKDLAFDVHKQDEWWRYFTYSLVHADESHLGLNLVLFVSIGTMLHMTNNTVTLLFLYILGVVSGSLTFYLFDATYRPLVGCSGGVYCLVGASLSTMILNWREDCIILFKYWPNRAPIAFCGRFGQILRLAAVVVIIGFEFIPAALRRYQNKDIGVSVVAHSFGFVCGCMVGAMVLRDTAPTVWKRRIKQVVWSVFVLGFGAALGINIVGSRAFENFWKTWSRNRKHDFENLSQ